MARFSPSPVDVELPIDLGDGCVLRRPVPDDAPRIADLCVDPEVARFTMVPGDYELQDARDFLARDAEAAAAGLSLTLAIVAASTDQVMGMCGFRVKAAERSGEIGYWLAPEARGHGTMTRAVRALVEIAFSAAGLGYVGFRVAQTNPSSRAVVERVGATLEGRHPAAALDGTSGDPDAPRVTMLSFGLRPGEQR